MASSSGSPCAACKFLRRKCTSECVFAPYFPPDQPQKFANVHKIFGASNIAKLLNELPQHQREDAVNSVAYEADARVKDPVYGCVGAISILQRRIAQLQAELAMTRSELSRYVGGTMVTGTLATHQQGSAASSPSLGISMSLSNTTSSREQMQLSRDQYISDYGRIAGPGPYQDQRVSSMAVSGSMGSRNIVAFPNTKHDPSEGTSTRAASGNLIGHFKVEQ